MVFTLKEVNLETEFVCNSCRVGNREFTSSNESRVDRRKQSVGNLV
mgnify:CR=1 FL=1